MFFEGIEKDIDRLTFAIETIFSGVVMKVNCISTSIFIAMFALYLVYTRILILRFD